jgi:hypothetical protein
MLFRSADRIIRAETQTTAALTASNAAKISRNIDIQASPFHVNYRLSHAGLIPLEQASHTAFIQKRTQAAFIRDLPGTRSPRGRYIPWHSEKDSPTVVSESSLRRSPWRKKPKCWRAITRHVASICFRNMVCEKSFGRPE